MRHKIGEFERYLPEDRTGISVVRNAKSGFIVCELDFFADPAKRSPEWAEEEAKKVSPLRWEVEYLRKWAVFKGKPVYKGAFYKHIHVANRPLFPDPNYPIFRGWDFGGNQSVAICQLIGGQIKVIGELPNRGKNTRTFAPEVITFCESTYGNNYDYIDVIDPSAMWEGKTATGAACADVMREFGIRPVAASTNDPERRIDAVTKFLMSVVGQERGLTISPECPIIIKGFESGYHYPEKPTQAQRADRPLKNLYSHVQDALQYVCVRCSRLVDNEGLSEEEEYDRDRTVYKFNG